MNYTPGQKVAHRVATGSEPMLMLGKVMPDGRNVLWQEMVNEHGVESNRNAPGIRPGRPVPLQGDELPCPVEFEQFIK